MKGQYVYSLADRSVHEKGGSKAKNLRFLLRRRFLVPAGFIVSWEALDDFSNHGDSVLNALRIELDKNIDPDRLYAVRSSASVEDDILYSYAGIFRSFLEVQGIESILETVQRVWQSLESDEFMTYRKNNPNDGDPVKLSVIVQEMVPAVSSGIAFSKNPLTGLSETIIEAGRGTGEEQAAMKRDPERWIGKWGVWLQSPADGILTDQLARLIMKNTKEIESAYGQPVDLEWAYDGKNLYFLQVRPITRLDIPVFSNRISKEMLPGIIKPLVWSVNTRLVNQTWVDILKKLTGDDSFEPEKLTGHFYYRAYFNITVFGRVFERLGMPYEALELLFGLEQEGPEKPRMRPGIKIVFQLPRLMSFAFDFIRIEARFKTLLQTKKKRYEELVREMSQDLSDKEWLDLANRVYAETRSVAYFNIMLPMLAMMHHRMLTGMLKKEGIDARTLELSGVSIVSEKNSPHIRLNQLHQQYYEGKTELTDDEQRRLDRDLELFLHEFGHYSDSGNDCSSIPWRETPDLIRQMIAQPTTKKSTSSFIAFDDLKLPMFHRSYLKNFYRRSSRFAVHRETISSLYTFGYGQFRRCFIGLGNRLVQQNVLERNDDVFYLYWQELVELVNHVEKPSQKELVLQRKRDIEHVADAMLPEMIFGFDQPPLIDEKKSSLHGIPTSLGTYTGPARILQRLVDFERLHQGDVLVIPFSDVGWTPLFAKAGAVVAESGGILSHSSIVAREYRIPAVVSVSGACRIAEGTMITVNGYTGDVFIAET
ncbi:MAG: hypothetical protein A2Y20_03545 [Firmicutes bacterium GWF2_51_9]|nr:MAG: hypothetical protein A2Y20_03545 [Firmicutes bacterium GWF2_51_9]OGS57867.1 MAG: hypothetical protein A2Y19_10345 [Firmicutes bacterium GWE2_51_13]